MTVRHRWESPEYDTGKSDDVLLIRDAAKEVHNIYKHTERWAETPTSPQGVVHLMRANEATDRFMGILESADWNPHRMMDRVTEGTAHLRAIEGQFYSGETTLGFNQGMAVQRNITYLERMAAEWEQIAEYADGKA